MIRAGRSLAELAAALAAGSILATLMATTLLLHVRTASLIAHATTTHDAFTLAEAVLGAETRDITDEDRTAIAADSLALRAFRATALVCDTTGTLALVRWLGARLPETAKDSTVILRGGTARIAPITAATPVADGCTTRADERIVRIDAGTQLLPGDVLLVFERGAYHLADRALRWRPAGATRQPLTADVLDGSSRFHATPVSVELVARRTHPHEPARHRTVRLRTIEPEHP